MMYVLFDVALWPFWILLVCALVAELIAIEALENASAATGILLVFLAGLFFFSNAHMIRGITVSQIITYGVLYLVAGVLYAFPRWMVYVKDKCNDFDSRYTILKRDWDSKHTNQVGHVAYEYQQYATFGEYLRSQHQMPPMPWDRGVKGKVYMWMAYWPLSGAWLMIHRPIEWFWDWAYATIRNNLEKLSYKIFSSHFDGR